jgi:mRNA interferase MazF
VLSFDFYVFFCINSTIVYLNQWNIYLLLRYLLMDSYVKRFAERCILKEKTHKDVHNTVFIKPRQIRFVKLGCNIWYEEDGKWDDFARPVLVINKIWNTFFVIPLTTWGKDHHMFYHTLTTTKSNKISRLILNQWRTISKERFMSHIDTVSTTEFVTIKKLLYNLYIGV